MKKIFSEWGDGLNSIKDQSSWENNDKSAKGWPDA